MKFRLRNYARFAGREFVERLLAGRIFAPAVLCLCVCALAACRRGERDVREEGDRRSLRLAVARQLVLPHDCAMPSVGAGGVFVADRRGVVSRLDSDLNSLWSVAPGRDRERFENSGSAEGDFLYLSSMQGGVYCLRQADGGVVWASTNRTDAVFAHAPLTGRIGGQSVLWLLSASDGVIHALGAADGRALWQSEETNRSDGGFVRRGNLLVYGNCDGAAHIFDAIDGRAVASVPIGDSDQMAGTPLATEAGELYIGTRSGKLALIDLETRTLAAVLPVSEEEAFATPVEAFDGFVAIGTGEGDVLLCARREGALAAVRTVRTAASVEHLAWSGSLLYVLSGGNLIAFNQELHVEASLNVADAAGGMALLEDGAIIIKAESALIRVKGEWQ
jgi:outer membrane protein assembly factor BamB